MANIIKPGSSSLNMENISDTLSEVYRHVTKLEPKYRADNDLSKPVLPKYQSLVQKADDVDSVAGIDADNIAISIDKDHRNTVQNSLELNGHPSSDYMLNTDGKTLVNRLSSSIDNYGNDLSDIRDELYQLKYELAKRGFIDNTYNYLGYTDIFRNGYKPYEYANIGQPANDCPDRKTIIMPRELIGNFDDGDFIVIYFRDADAINVRQISHIGPDQETIFLDEAMDAQYNLKAENMILSKSYGVSKDGNFYFAKDEKVSIGAQTYYTGFDDDTAYKFRKPINSSDNGYGYSFRIPEQKLGFLTKLSIQARAIGNPSLICYIIDEQDIGNFRNPLQAEALYKSGDTNLDGEPKMHFFAKSAPVSIDPAMGQHMITFDFFDASTNSYPLLKRKDTVENRVRYVAIILGTYVDSSNYAEVLFLQHKEQDSTYDDLELNNTTYRYTAQSEKSTISALTTDEILNKSDMYYDLVIKEVAYNAFTPIERGLYSAKIKCCYPKGISRARLTLKVSREGGLWNAQVSTPGIYGGITKNTSFTVDTNPQGKIRSASTIGIANKIRKPLELRDPTNPADIYLTPDLIVGSNLVKGAITGIDVTPEEPIEVYPDDKVYRNAYIVSVKGKNYIYEEKLQKYIVQSSQKIYLKPVAVIHDGIDPMDKYSDRIIFEGDFGTDKMPAYFNELELQIYWEESNFDGNPDVRAKQMGVIHSLIFSTDRVVK